MSVRVDQPHEPDHQAHREQPRQKYEDLVLPAEGAQHGHALLQGFFRHERAGVGGGDAGLLVVLHDCG